MPSTPLGLVATILVLLRIGHIARAGRALLLAQFFGSIVLLLAGLVVQQYLFIFFVFLGGMWRCGHAHVSHNHAADRATSLACQSHEFLRFFVYGGRSLGCAVGGIHGGSGRAANGHCCFVSGNGVLGACDGVYQPLMAQRDGAITPVLDCFENDRFGNLRAKKGQHAAGLFCSY